MLAQGVMGSVLEDMAQAEDSTDSWSEDVLLLGLLSLGMSQGESLGLVLVCLQHLSSTCLFSSVTEREQASGLEASRGSGTQQGLSNCYDLNACFPPEFLQRHPKPHSGASKWGLWEGPRPRRRKLHG